MAVKPSRRRYVINGAWVGAGLVVWGNIVAGLNTHVSTFVSVAFFCVSVGAAIGYIVHWIDENT